jgi:hypothetical protein
MGLRRTDNRPYDTHLFPHYNKKARHINVLTNFNGFSAGPAQKNSGAADNWQPRRDRG